jgi:hypothetical protein
MLLGLGIPLLVWSQSASRLEVEASPGQGVKIVAQQVSYGEVLRALAQKLGVPMDIPPAADQLVLSYAHIDAATPAQALQKLLTGSGLGYALLQQVGGNRLQKVIVVHWEGGSTGQREPPPVPAATPPRPRPAAAQASMPSRRPDWQEVEVDDSEGESAVPEAQRRPLSEAGEVIGMDSGPEAAAALAEQVSELPVESYPVIHKFDSLAVASLPPQDSPVRQEFDPLPVIRPLAAAAELMGLAPGVSPAEVGKTKTYPLPAAQKQKRP